MKNLLIMVLVFIVGCGNNDQKINKVNPEQVKELMVEFLYAGNHSDFDKLKNLTTEDFLMFGDEGEWNLNDLMQFIKDWPDPDEYSFNEFGFEIETDCNGAFVNYYYGPIDSDDKDQIDLHSVYIKRVENKLKINFLHSTTVKNKASFKRL
ncbi:MAG: hypothetical protein KJN66_08805 [Bacteroidia bacterium]|nr:hypothetical protein [Bacteroidia bacterium]